MSKKNSSGMDDGGLSLTGSQISTPQNSSRRSNSRPSSASGARQKTPASPSSRVPASPGRTKRHDVTGGASHRSDASGRVSMRANQNASGDSARKTGRDDFLSLFESGPAPQIKKPQQKSRAAQKSKPAWAAVGSSSARSNHSAAASSSAAGGGGAAASTSGKSHTSAAQSHHSVFTPITARTNSSEEEDAEFNALMSRISQSEEALELHSVTGLSSHRGGEKMSPRVAAIDQVMNNIDGRQRHLSHGENDLSLTSDETMAGKATKLNSIANNMTLQKSSSNRTPLENSVQNIKHKTPVNQVKEQSSQNYNVNSAAQGQHRQYSRQGSRSSHDHDLDRRRDIDLEKRKNMAAIRIQRFYQRYARRKRSGQAALRRLLDQKKKDRESDAQEYLPSNDESREAARKKVREEKARQARQEAIKELQRKREEKRDENKRVSEEELVFLKASGKVGKQPARRPNTASNKKDSARRSNKGPLPESEESPVRSGTAPSTSRSARSNGQQMNGDDRNGSNEAAAAQISTRESSATASLLASAREALTQRSEEASHADTKTTLEDLMSTISKLEEGASFEKAERSKNEKPLAWLDEMEARAEKSELYLSTDNLERLDKDNLKKSGLLSDEKLRNIITYLDEVETAERLSQIDQELAKANEALETPALLLPSGEELVELEQASANAAEVTSSVLKQKMELEEKKRSVSILQKALKQQRELTVRHARETEREMKKRLDVQKDEYEDTIKRHLSFIDQLIDDKKSLSEKCEALVKELKTVDKKYGDKFKSTSDQHDQELRKIKEVHAAAEKLRREKWIDEKTKKIKEMTVKGLEPEIQRLIAKHNAEIKKLKSIHEAELLASDERAGGKYIRMTEELRDQLAHEKEQACARERELARKTYEKQMQQEEEAYQSQRRRLYAEVQEEKERLAQQAHRQRTELDKLQRQLEDQTTHATEAMRREYETARDEQEKRHTAETRQLKEQLAVEKGAWEENYMKKQDTWCMQKERELKEAVRKERDKEIELVIRRLEEDNQTARDECERVADNRIKRIRDKYESEMSELERSERLTTEKYNQTKAQLAEMEGENERMKVTLRQKDKEIDELKKLLDKLNEERSHVSDVIRQEFADRIVATEEENRRIKNNMSELKAKHKIELERGRAEIEVVQKAKDEEMEEVHKRVKQAILKKEEVMTQLRQQYQAAQKRADHLEGLLEQQRKQLLGNRK